MKELGYQRHEVKHKIPKKGGYLPNKNMLIISGPNFLIVEHWYKMDDDTWIPSISNKQNINI